jgi:regulator of cell morphogenesis and NO signaling
MSEPIASTMVSEIVAADFRTAAVFEQFGIDFCCGGGRSVAEACHTAAADPRAVERALHALPPAEGHDPRDVTRWPVDRLIDHIVTIHHGYVRSAVLTVGRYLTKLVEVHGARRLELYRVKAAFDQMSADLVDHMIHEERVLFPSIRALASPSNGARLPRPFGAVENQIRLREMEHQEAGDALRLIHDLTNGYKTPSDGCLTYRVCFAELAQFERDLHRHVHLEDDVLYPKAVELEQRSRRGTCDSPSGEC